MAICTTAISICLGESTLLVISDMYLRWTGYRDLELAYPQAIIVMRAQPVRDFPEAGRLRPRWVLENSETKPKATQWGNVAN